jgi:hypothetical protein
MAIHGISKKRQEMGEEAWALHQKKLAVKKICNFRRNLKKRLIEYKGGVCEACGYDKAIPDAYAFHHKDPSQKDFGLSRKGYCHSFRKACVEVDKCALL